MINHPWLGMVNNYLWWWPGDGSLLLYPHYRKSQFLMGKLIISVAILSSHVGLPEGKVEMQWEMFSEHVVNMWWRYGGHIWDDVLRILKVKMQVEIYVNVHDFVVFHGITWPFPQLWKKELEHLAYFADGFPMRHWDFTLSDSFAGVRVWWWNVGSNAVHESSRQKKLMGYRWASHKGNIRI